MDFNQHVCKSVILQVWLEDLRISHSLWGMIVGENRTTVRFRLRDDTYMDVDKSVIREVITDCEFLNR
jgi:hypothetical protein